MSADQTKKSGDGDVSKDKQNATANVFDCKLIVGNEPDKIETVLGCKFQFAIESPVFESMLFGEQALALQDGIPLPDDDPKAVRHFRLLTCCNSSRASRLEALNLDELVNLTLFCEKYKALSISKLCYDRLDLTVSNGSDTDLMKLLDCRDILSETNNLRIKFEQKLCSRQYPLNSGINSARPESVANYIAKIFPLGHRTSIHIFNTIEKYLEHNDLIPKVLLDHDKCHEPTPNGDKMDKLEKYDAEIKKYKAEKNKQKFLIKLLKIIDFGPLSISEFFTGPSESKLLTTNQKYFILTRICKSIKQIKLYQE